MPTTEVRVRLADYDWVVINSSAGKDSQAMLSHIVAMARAQNFPCSRLVVVHADLGTMEWEGTRELAEAQAKAYELRFEVVRRRTRAGATQTLLEHVKARGKWPGAQSRYCTSDHKRGPVMTLLTRLAAESRARGVRRPRILNCLGLRADESRRRAKEATFKHDAPASNGRRHVDRWLPIHDWSVEDVWQTIKASGLPHHKAYDLGMPRLSCCFCIFAPREALMLAGKHNPGLLAQYVEVETNIGHSFRVNLKLADVQADLACGKEPGTVRTWEM